MEKWLCETIIYECFKNKLGILLEVASLLRYNKIVFQSAEGELLSDTAFPSFFKLVLQVFP